MRPWPVRGLLILVVGWTLGCAFVPVHVGIEVGMASKSCGPAVTNLVNGGLSEYGPAIAQVCQNNAQDRFVLWLAYSVPVLIYALLRSLKRRSMLSAGVTEPTNKPRWADALTYVASTAGWMIVPIVVFFAANDRALRRNAARAIELQLLLPAAALWLFALAPLTGDRGLSWLVVPGLLFAVATASIGTLLCAVLALVAPARLEAWEPLLARRKDISSSGAALRAAV